MRITILSREFPPAVSGIGDHTDLLAGTLAARGHTVTVVCSAGDAPARETVDVRPVIQRWDGRGRRAIVQAVAHTAPDMILWQYNPFSIGRRGIALWAGRLARALAATAPLVTLFHELWFPWGLDGLKGAVWASAQRVQARGVLRASSAWIVSTEERERLLAHRDPAKTHRIPVGPNVLPVGDRDRSALGIPEDAFVVAHFGSVGPGRDLAPVLTAIERLRADGTDARALLVGNTGPFTPPRGLNGAVVTTGVRPHAQLSRALAAADVYHHSDPVGPSIGRRGSLVAAVAHALPLVGFRGPDTAGELRDGHNCVLVERDPDALTAALRRLAADRDERARLSRAIGETYDRSFSWRRIGDAVSDVLEAVR